MPPIKHAALALLALALCQPAQVWAEEKAQAPALRIEVPVPLKPAKVVFNMDHLAFVGEQPVGLTYMKSMLESFKAAKVPVEIVAVFHGGIGYVLLNDAAYNARPASWKGNPFKEQIKALQAEGVQFEMCANTARNNGWMNADFLPGVKVNGGAILRIVELAQDGYVQIQP